MKRLSCSVALVLLVAGCDAGGGLGGSSPEAVLNRAEAARKTEDWHTYVGCLTPESQQSIVESELSSFLSIHAFADLGGPEARQKMQPFYDALAKHGITSAKLDELSQLQGPQRDQALRAMVAGIADKQAFAADLMKPASSTLNDRANVQRIETHGTVKSVDIQGDTATAVIAITGGGQNMEQRMQLKNTAAGWKIDLTGADGPFGS